MRKTEKSSENFSCNQGSVVTLSAKTRGDCTTLSRLLLAAKFGFRREADCAWNITKHMQAVVAARRSHFWLPRLVPSLSGDLRM